MVGPKRQFIIPLSFASVTKTRNSPQTSPFLGGDDDWTTRSSSYIDAMEKVFESLTIGTVCSVYEVGYAHSTTNGMVRVHNFVYVIDYRYSLRLSQGGQ